MKFELKSYHRNTSEEDLLSDVRKVAQILKKNTVSVSEYQQHGQFHPTTLMKRFGSWNNTLEKAKLKKGMIFDTSQKDLFNNLEEIWTKLGRQPKASEIKSPLSMYSIRPYLSQFGTWQNALKGFIDYINNDQSDDLDISKPIVDSKNRTIIHKTKRDISDRLRFRILMRDGFTCRKCGSSPLKRKDVELHVDHILPWSKGGETVLENLETKCDRCNLGKGNAFDV